MSKADHLDMLQTWTETVRAIKKKPEGVPEKILRVAESSLRLRAFTLMPEGPENALALLTLTEMFRAWRGDDLSTDDVLQITHAHEIAAIVLNRRRAA